MACLAHPDHYVTLNHLKTRNYCHTHYPSLDDDGILESEVGMVILCLRSQCLHFQRCRLSSSAYLNCSGHLCRVFQPYGPRCPLSSKRPINLISLSSNHVSCHHHVYLMIFTAPLSSMPVVLRAPVHRAGPSANMLRAGLCCSDFVPLMVLLCFEGLDPCLEGAGVVITTVLWMAIGIVRSCCRVTFFLTLPGHI